MCIHSNPIYINSGTKKGFWYCDDCNHKLPQYIVDFKEKFNKFMKKRLA